MDDDDGKDIDTLYRRRIAELEAERDRLRAEGDALHDWGHECEAERDRLRALAFMLYRTLSDEPIEDLPWLLPDAKALLAQVVDDLSPHLSPERQQSIRYVDMIERDEGALLDRSDVMGGSDG